MKKGVKVLVSISALSLFAVSSPVSIPEKGEFIAGECGGYPFKGKLLRFGPKYDMIRVVEGNGVCSAGKILRLSNYDILKNGKIIGRQIKGGGIPSMSPGGRLLSKKNGSYSHPLKETGARHPHVRYPGKSKTHKKRKRDPYLSDGEYIEIKDGVDFDKIDDFGEDDILYPAAGL